MEQKYYLWRTEGNISNRAWALPSRVRNCEAEDLSRVAERSVWPIFVRALD